MDYTTAALTYALMLIPAGFALVMIGQGVQKIQKKDESGRPILIFGVLFLILIPVIHLLLTYV